MAQINLLPWREQARQDKRTRFMVTLGIFIGITLFFILILHLYVSNEINLQLQRNTYLQLEFDQTKAEVAALKIKQKDQIALMAQLHFIIDLRNKSFIVIRLLAELSQAVPDALLINKIERKENIVTVVGKAESNSQVTTFMKNIALSPIFNQPDLTEISAEKKGNSEEKYFQLTVVMKE
jgi:type IV pilus assembly protein PilN